MNNKIISLLYILCTCLVIFTSSSYAIVRTEEVNEWTQDSLGTYFNKYRILYDRTSDYKSLTEIAQSYKDAAASNTKYFLGDGIDQMLSGFAATLRKKTHLAQNDVQGFLTDLKHELRQLELRGELSKERVKAVLDKAQTKALRQKILTEAEWQKAVNLVESYFQQPSWFQRVLGGKSYADSASSAFNGWLKSVVDRVTHVGDLTKEQAKDIGEQLRSSISKTDIHRIGDKAWLEQLSESISKQTQLKKDQLDNIIQSIDRDVHGYKIFGLEYTGQAKAHVKSWIERVKYGFEDIWYQIRFFVRRCKSHVYNLLHSKQFQDSKAAAIKASSSVASVAHSLSDDLADSPTIQSAISKASDAAAQVTSKIHDLGGNKNSFSHFWHQKERDAYRKLGYTEAHIDWIEDYLYKTFKDQKSSAEESVDDASSAVKSYLEGLKIQTPKQIDQNINKLKQHWKSWSS